MKKIILATAVVLAGFSSLAYAEDSHDCGNAPQEKWMSKEALADKAKTMGLDVRRVKIEGGCYEVYAIDAKGNKVETLFNPETGEMLGNEGAE